MPLRVRLKTSDRSKVRVKGTGGGSKLGDGNKSKSREGAKRLSSKNAPKHMDSNGDSLRRGRKEKTESSFALRKGKFGSFNIGSKKKTTNADFSDRIEGGKARVKGGKSFENAKFSDRIEGGKPRVKGGKSFENAKFSDRIEGGKPRVKDGKSFENAKFSDRIEGGKPRVRGGKSFEISKERIRVKGKGVDEIAPSGQSKRGAKNMAFEEREKSEGDVDPVEDQKIYRSPSRVLDKTGKKIRVSRKGSSDESNVETSAPKKRKRVIKLDPYDMSNKRLDDTPRQSDNVAETKTEMSKNAQFRAIQPSPSILSFVEDNLLGRRRLIELQNAGYNVKLSAPLDNIPFSTSKERERIEENIFRSKLEFFAAAKISSSFPPPMVPEIAFAGRSNVGKSSLLNALTRQWGVVRTSDRPGHTKTINFFRLASKLCLVDLPGYGFAYAKEEVKDAWEELVKEYVSTRVGLQRVCLLIDTKWGMKPRDHELVELMERSQTPYQIVLTKTDVVFPIDVARQATQIQENLKNNKSIVNPLMMVSSKSGAGVCSLRTALAKLARFVKP